MIRPAPLPTLGGMAVRFPAPAVPGSPVRLARTPGRPWPVPQADVRAFLRARVRPGTWRLQVPAHGFSAGGCVLARHADGSAVAVRLGLDAAPVRVLAAAGLTPTLLAAGRRHGTLMHAQMLAEGRHPDGAWYAAHLSDVATLLRRLTELTPLRELLPVPADQGYAAALRRYHRACAAIIERLPAGAAYRPAVETLLQELTPRIDAVGGTGLVPVHGDPNDGNLLVTADGPVLLDWETLHLSDPVHDLAQVLWWGVPRARWPAGLAAFGLPADDRDVIERLHLHAALRALYVFLLFERAGGAPFPNRFLDDAQHAAAGRGPRTFLLGGERPALDERTAP